MLTRSHNSLSVLHSLFSLSLSLSLFSLSFSLLLFSPSLSLLLFSLSLSLSLFSLSHSLSHTILALALAIPALSLPLTYYSHSRSHSRSHYSRSRSRSHDSRYCLPAYYGRLVAQLSLQEHAEGVRQVSKSPLPAASTRCRMTILALALATLDLTRSHYTRLCRWRTHRGEIRNGRRRL